MATPKSGPTAPIIFNKEQIEQLETLAGMGCTMIEMANFFKCHVDTLRDNYSTAIARGREVGKVSVRRMLWAQGAKGNSVALKYLVHNVLKEKLEDQAIIGDAQMAAAALLDKLQAISSEQILKIVRDTTKAS